MDAKAQAEVMASNIQNGILTPNEARRKLNRPDDPDGNQLFIQSNLMPLKGATNAAQVQPAAPPQ